MFHYNISATKSILKFTFFFYVHEPLACMHGTTFVLMPSEVRGHWFPDLVTDSSERL